jgi:hypothetical protein
MIKRFILMGMCGALAGCGPATGNRAEPSPTPTPMPTFKPVGEVKGIALGASFEEVIGSVDAQLFNPYSLKECFSDIALRGCSLSRKSDDTVFEMRVGIPYALTLSFNRADKLTDIGLNYHREKGISGEQCRDLFARTIAWVAKDYGPLTHKRAGDEPGKPAGNLVGRTPDGASFEYLKPDAAGSFVTQFMHLASETFERRTVDGKVQGRTLSRTISLFSSYIVVGHGICDIDVDFKEPDTIERAAIVTEGE